MFFFFSFLNNLDKLIKSYNLFDESIKSETSSEQKTHTIQNGKFTTITRAVEDREDAVIPLMGQGTVCDHSH